MKSEFGYENALIIVFLWADTGSKVRKNCATSGGKVVFVLGFFFPEYPVVGYAS